MTSANDALDELERFLERAHPGFADDRKLHSTARALSEAYTTDAAVDADAAASVAYLAHFGPRAIAGVAHALAHVDVKGLTCVDVGAGSGASSLALFAAGAHTVTLVERNRACVDLARRLLAGHDARFVIDVAGAARGNDATVAVSSFAFGELPGTPREAFALLEKTAPKAKLHVLVDAGDRVRARRIQQLRDALVVEGRTIAAPCPHRDACPALTRERDWCHTRIAKHLPDKLARFARAVGRDDVAMSLSFLVVDDRAATSAAPSNEDGVLAIGDALVEKGRARLPVCGPRGLRFVQALKRHRAAHDALVAIERGTRLPAALAKGETTVSVGDVDALRSTSTSTSTSTSRS